MDSNIARLLEAEKKANSIVEAAQRAKQNNLKESEEKQKLEIAAIRAEEEKKFNQLVNDVTYITQKYGNVNEAAVVESQVEKEINEMKAQFNNGRGKVINLLLENVINVDLEVPEVVKGEYDKLA